MLYYLFDYLNSIDVPGAGVFQYISFRAAMAVILSLIVSMFFGKYIIRFLLKKQVGETVRDLGLEGEKEKQGTPTMGGLMILGSILVPTLLFAKLDNIYIILMLVSTVLLGTLGFIDDYIKVFKKNKEGLQGKFKIIGQVAIGIIAGSILYFHEDVSIKERVENPTEIVTDAAGNEIAQWEEHRSTVTTIPFVKNNEFDYSWLLSWMGENWIKYTWIIFIPSVILVVTAV